MKTRFLILGSFLAGSLIFTAGCATRSQHRRDITNLQAQIGSLQGEIARLDQQFEMTNVAVRGARAGRASEPSRGVAVPGAEGEGPLYRTPSGFEVPAMSIQRALKNAGYYDGEIDGKVGRGTKEAIRNFQRDQGLTADGVCGRQTWARLQSFA